MENIHLNLFYFCVDKRARYTVSADDFVDTYWKRNNGDTIKFMKEGAQHIVYISSKTGNTISIKRGTFSYFSGTITITIAGNGSSCAVNDNKITYQGIDYVKQTIPNTDPVEESIAGTTWKMTFDRNDPEDAFSYDIVIKFISGSRIRWYEIYEIVDGSGGHAINEAEYTYNISSKTGSIPHLRDDTDSYDDYTFSIQNNKMTIDPPYDGNSPYQLTKVSNYDTLFIDDEIALIRAKLDNLSYDTSFIYTSPVSLRNTFWLWTGTDFNDETGENEEVAVVHHFNLTSNLCTQFVSMPDRILLFLNIPYALSGNTLTLGDDNDEYIINDYEMDCGDNFFESLTKIH